MTSPSSAKMDRSGNAIGAALIVGAVFLMAGQDALIKYMSVDLALGQIFLLRSIMVLPLLTLLYRRGAGQAWRGALAPWPLLRGLFLTLMYMTLYSVIDILPLASLAAGFYTGPLFITLLAALLLKERVGAFGWAGVSVGFLGVLVLLHASGADPCPLRLSLRSGGHPRARQMPFRRAGVPGTVPEPRPARRRGRDQRARLSPLARRK